MKEYAKGIIRIDGLDLEKTHVWIDPPGKSQAFGMPILDFAKIMERVISDGNVTSIKKEETPMPPPGVSSQAQPSYITTDDNFLYVWVNGKWKRTPLSDW